MSLSPAPIFLIAFIKFILKHKYTQNPRGYLMKPLFTQLPPLSSTLWTLATLTLELFQYAKLSFWEILVCPVLLPSHHFLQLATSHLLTTISCFLRVPSPRGGFITELFRIVSFAVPHPGLL